MESWVYVFSKFTQEALLFEALVLFIGFAAYAAFYITKKRKWGVAGQEVPSNLVKVYLSQLMVDAEDLRTQLFGLLGKGEAQHRILTQFTTEAIPATQLPANMPAVPASGATAAGPATVADPNLAKQMKELEAKMAEQAKALDSVLNEKMRLEEELAIAKTDADKGGGDPDSKAKDLSDRVKTLEAQLAEYAIIEDDLANLKRLQKENKSLRSQIDELSQKTGGAAAAPAAAAPELPAAEAATPADVDAALASAAKEAKTDGAPEAAAPKETSAAPDAGAEAQNFDALVDDVEKSLADPKGKEQTESAPDVKELQAAAETKELPAKSEEELQADFEKMLKS